MKEIILAVAVMSAVTAAIRFTPFLLLSGERTPKAILYLGRVLPFAVMGMLVVYCMKDVSFTSLKTFLPELIATAAVVGSYVWKRNSLLSIVGGTILYMLLVQLVFV